MLLFGGCVYTLQRSLVRCWAQKRRGMEWHGQRRNLMVVMVKRELPPWRSGLQAHPAAAAAAAAAAAVSLPGFHLLPLLPPPPGCAAPR